MIPQPPHGSCQCVVDCALTFSPPKFFRNKIRDKYYPFSEPKFGHRKNGRCRLQVYIFGGKNSELYRSIRMCCRVNKIDGKINGGMMIPRFLFQEKVKVLFNQLILFIQLREFCYWHQSVRIGSRTRIEWHENRDNKFPKLTRAVVEGE